MIGRNFRKSVLHVRLLGFRFHGVLAVLPDIIGELPIRQDRKNSFGRCCPDPPS